MHFPSFYREIYSFFKSYDYKSKQFLSIFFFLSDEINIINGLFISSCFCAYLCSVNGRGNCFYIIDMIETQAQKGFYFAFFLLEKKIYEREKRINQIIIYLSISTSLSIFYPHIFIYQLLLFEFILEEKRFELYMNQSSFFDVKI